MKCYRYSKYYKYIYIYYVYIAVFMEKSNHQATLVASCCYHLPFFIGWSNFLVRHIVKRTNVPHLVPRHLGAICWSRFSSVHQTCSSQPGQIHDRRVRTRLEMSIFIYIMWNTIYIYYKDMYRNYEHINLSTSHEISYMSISLNDYGTFIYIYTYIYICIKSY